MKKILYSIIFIFLCFVCIEGVNAGSLSINGNASVYVGNALKVTVNFNNIAGRFKIISSDQSILAGGNEDFYDNQSVSFTFTAKSEGTATITVVPVGAIGDYDNEEYTGGSRTLTVKVIKKNTKPSIDVNKVYDKNNYLANLSIEGYTLSPGFNKETLEYEVELEPGTEKVNVNASLESKKANIKGSGEVSVVEGVNTLNIIVTAENGNERTYKINAKVAEKNPINVKIDGKKYTIVKKRELLETKSSYEETVVSIENFDIPALYNDITKVTLVGVKDGNGEITLVSYNSKTGEYNLYHEYSFDLMNLYVHESSDNKYEKQEVKINGQKVTGYKLNGMKDYCLLYATNTVTGYEGYYLYDTKENSVQRYDTTLLDNINNKKDKYLTVVIVLSSVCFLTMLFLLIEVNKYHKKNEV